MSINFFTHFLEKHFLEKHFLEKHFLEKHFLEKHFLEKSVSKNTRVTLTYGQRYQKSKARDASNADRRSNVTSLSPCLV